MNIVKKDNDSYSLNELSNLSKNIRSKAIKLGVTLPKLAEIIGIDYVTLTRIVNYKNDYMPNLKALAKIASFFEVGIGDLLTNPDIPQYIPVLQLYEVENFLQEACFNLKERQMVFSSEWVHEKAFAIAVLTEYFGQRVEIKFLLKPYNKIKIDAHILLKHQDKYYFLRILEYNDIYVFGNNILENEDLKLPVQNIKIVAIASKMTFNNNLI
ncbi:MAG: helix-turn-helix domain-containing protein [Neisseriaceae bacterium]